MFLVELRQRLRRDDVEMPLASATDGSLEPPLFNPVDNLALANAKNGSQALYGEEIAPNIPQAQVGSAEYVANRLGGSIELLGDLLSLRCKGGRSPDHPGGDSGRQQT
jgi:hypothetical protein